MMNNQIRFTVLCNYHSCFRIRVQYTYVFKIRCRTSMVELYGNLKCIYMPSDYLFCIPYSYWVLIH